jgi:uncharacterized phage protein (TIGR01671 family)
MGNNHKFRAWDNKKKEMVYDKGHCSTHDPQPTNLGILYWRKCSDNGSKVTVDGRSYYDDWDSMEINFDCVVELCAGEKDKNGKLIYEGDIKGESWWKYVICYGKFTFKDDDAGLEIEQIGFYKKYLDKENGVDVFDLIKDIDDPYIGNIHQNPELLEENATNKD